MKKQRFYKWVYGLFIGFVTVTFLRETGNISLNSYQQEGVGGTIGGGVKGTIPPHQIQSGTLFFHAVPSSVMGDEYLLKGIYADLENRPTTYRKQVNVEGWGWEYPESVASYRATQKQQAQNRADYASGKYQIKKEDVGYFIFPEPTPVQIQFKIHKCKTSGFFGMPLYKNIKAEYKAEIIFPDVSKNPSVFVSGNWQTKIKGFCSAREAKKLLSRNIARNIRSSAVNAYLKNYQKPTENPPKQEKERVL
jgi:hypothetical protein